MPRPFLTATWSNLINLTYEVPPELLLPHTPSHTDLDVQDGHAFVSLVAFDFLDTRVFGIPWPGFRNFPELNLRFYVKRKEDGARGVVFLREYVPQGLVAGMARMFYNEPYVAAPMSSTTRDEDDLITFELTVTTGGRDHTVRATGLHPAITHPEDSREHYFKEHTWGFGQTRGGKPLTYQVQHPVWQAYRLQSWSADVDFAILYGQPWAFLQDATPALAMLAVGSRVEVFPKTLIP